MFGIFAISRLDIFFSNKDGAFVTSRGNYLDRHLSYLTGIKFTRPSSRFFT